MKGDNAGTIFMMVPQDCEAKADGNVCHLFPSLKSGSGLTLKGSYNRKSEHRQWKETMGDGTHPTVFPLPSQIRICPSIFGNPSFSNRVHGVQVMSSPYVVPALVHVFQAKEGSTRSQSGVLPGVVDRESVFFFPPTANTEGRLLIQRYHAPS